MPRFVHVLSSPWKPKFFLSAATFVLVGGVLSGCAGIGHSSGTTGSNQPPSPLSITVTSLPAATVQISYSAMISVSGGTAPYRWSVTAGSLPAGLSLAAATGVISGTPASAGTFNFTVQVTDSTAPKAQTASQALSIAVTPTSSPLTITSSSLPGATQSIAYIATFAASGGQTPYTWSISSGSLPPGLSLAASTGIISGTPTAAGTFTFPIKVTDSSTQTPQTATANLSLSVAATSSHSVLLSWTASPTATVTGYNVYRSVVSGGPYELLTTTPVSGLTYVDTAVASATTYYYVTTAVDNRGDESVYSPEFQITIP